VYHDLVMGFCRDMGFTLSVRHEADHPQTVLSLVAVGIGIARLPRDRAEAGAPDRPTAIGTMTVLCSKPWIQPLLAIITEEGDKGCYVTSH